MFKVQVVSVKKTEGLFFANVMHCSRLQLQVGCSLHFESTLMVFYVIFLVDVF